jgi:hypothetical protein
MSNTDAGAIREKAEAMLAKARQDDTFAHALRDEPEDVLRAQGFQGEALDTFVSEITADDVVAYQRCSNYTCILTSCFFTKLTGG